MNAEIEEETTTLIGKFSRDYQITGSLNDITPISEIKSKSYGKDWNKLKIELEGLGVIVKKDKIRTSIYRDKVCCFGVRKINVETEEVEYESGALGLLGSP